MVKSLLSPNQKNFLDFFSKEKFLRDLFYLTGGTALSEFYLRHRYSEDLDFFSEKEFELKDVSLFLESKKNLFGRPKIEYKRSFNRNIFQLLYPRDVFLKVEFTYFPFTRINIANVINDIQVDSLIDIAVNKLFTIYQNPRGRDYFDLYFILKKDKTISIGEIIKLARVKFDTGIDYLQLGMNMLKVNKLFDDPILRDRFDKKAIETSFTVEAEKLRNKIIK